MDARQFDGIAKALSSGADRRRVLSSLTVGALAGFLGWHTADAAQCAKEGQKPKGDKKPCCAPLVPVDGRCGACGGQYASCTLETEATDCCSGECTIPWGCCPVCPPGCSCALVQGDVLACTDRGGSHIVCGGPNNVQCPPGEACFGQSSGNCFTTCTPVT
jgi:hypothetical protein